LLRGSEDGPSLRAASRSERCGQAAEEVSSSAHRVRANHGPAASSGITRDGAVFRLRLIDPTAGRAGTDRTSRQHSRPSVPPGIARLASAICRAVM